MRKRLQLKFLPCWNACEDWKDSLMIARRRPNGLDGAILSGEAVAILRISTEQP